MNEHKLHLKARRIKSVDGWVTELRYHLCLQDDNGFLIENHRTLISHHPLQHWCKQVTVISYKNGRKFYILWQDRCRGWCLCCWTLISSLFIFRGKFNPMSLHLISPGPLQGRCKEITVMLYKNGHMCQWNFIVRQICVLVPVVIVLFAPKFRPCLRQLFPVTELNCHISLYYHSSRRL
jgi:hypothetical protein